MAITGTFSFLNTIHPVTLNLLRNWFELLQWTKPKLLQQCKLAFTLNRCTLLITIWQTALLQHWKQLPQTNCAVITRESQVNPRRVLTARRMSHLRGGEKYIPISHFVQEAVWWVSDPPPGDGQLVDTWLTRIGHHWPGSLPNAGWAVCVTTPPGLWAAVADDDWFIYIFIHLFLVHFMGTDSKRFLCATLQTCPDIHLGSDVLSH